MKDYKTEYIRNIGLAGHGGAGKTSFGEAMLYVSGATNRLGRVEDGNTVLDSDPDEIQRKISINLSSCFFEWNEHKINLVVCPGYIDFCGEVVAGLRAIDMAVIVISGVSGVEWGSEFAWETANLYGLPKAIFVSKMKRDNTDIFKILEGARKAFGKEVTIFSLPIGKSDGLKGVIDLLGMKAYILSDDGKEKESEIPKDMEKLAKEEHEHLIESIAASDDSLIEKYLEEGSLSHEEIRKGIKTGIIERKIVPLFCGDSSVPLGVQNFLNAVVDFFPSPSELPPLVGKEPNSMKDIERKRDENDGLCAFAFKTVSEPHTGAITYIRVFSGMIKAGEETYNASRDKIEKTGQLFFPKGKERIDTKTPIVAGDICIGVKLKETMTNDTLSSRNSPFLLSPMVFPLATTSVAIEPKTKGDEEKVSVGLSKLREEDPSFAFNYNSEVKQMQISGLGELHLDVIVGRLKRKFGLEINLLKTKIPYKETIKTKVETEYKHKKQTGGHGQYGHVLLRLEPLPRGGGFEFVDEIKGGVVPSNYIPSVEKGVRAAMQEGVLAGYPVVDVKTALYFGSYHPVDSSGTSFEIAGNYAFRKGILEGKPILLEPIQEVEVTVPEECMGDVVGDINSKRGKILGIDSKRGFQVIKALVPLAELYKYSTTLRSMTQGRGGFTMKFSYYEEVPHEIAQKVIEETKKEKEEKGK